MKMFISRWLQNCVTAEMSLNRPLHSEDWHVRLKDLRKSVTLAQIIRVKHIKSNAFALFISPSGQMCARPSARISRGLLLLLLTLPHYCESSSTHISSGWTRDRGDRGRNNRALAFLLESISLSQTTWYVVKIKRCHYRFTITIIVHWLDASIIVASVHTQKTLSHLLFSQTCKMVIAINETIWRPRISFCTIAFWSNMSAGLIINHITHNPLTTPQNNCN